MPTGRSKSTHFTESARSAISQPFRTRSAITAAQQILSDHQASTSGQALPCDIGLTADSSISQLTTLCLKKKGPTLKRYSSKLYGSILMIFGGNIQKSLE